MGVGTKRARQRDREHGAWSMEGWDTGMPKHTHAHAPLGHRVRHVRGKPSCERCPRDKGESQTHAGKVDGKKESMRQGVEM